MSYSLRYALRALFLGENSDMMMMISIDDADIPARKLPLSEAMTSPLECSRPKG